ncbi:DNA glycosylase [Leucosporidium creatinivorum]|uniref:DNA glycosylase n=1 Tax=Leucosporidium creatinivorum TaxID=106004 RepID=A0A1Y2EY75_9BASI|nr:DNA glycosylase [Leucosporidium creatinivorum]
MLYGDAEGRGGKREWGQLQALGAPENDSQQRQTLSLDLPSPLALTLGDPLRSPSTPTSNKKVKLTPSTPLTNSNTKTQTPTTPLSASAKKKLSLYTTSLGHSPFPTYARPTPSECQKVHDLLSTVHGIPSRPVIVEDRPNAAAGCGQVPSVLDALIRTILSQNTTSKNSTAAKNAMDGAYGRAGYRAVLEGGEERLKEVIRCGGLAGMKSKAILGVLRRVDEREKGKGELSLEYLREMTDQEAMQELITFDLVGIKTASCVLLFCLGRESFAVDTHVHRLSLSLSWAPPTATRDETFFHLDALIPPNLKYGLHCLMVRHGRGCRECSANGVTSMDWVETCPIRELVKGKGRGKGGKGKAKAALKGGKKGKKVAKEEAEDDEKPEVKGEEDEKAVIKSDVEGSPSKRTRSTRSTRSSTTQVPLADVGGPAGVKTEVVASFDEDARGMSGMGAMHGLDG